MNRQSAQSPQEVRKRPTAADGLQWYLCRSAGLARGCQRLRSPRGQFWINDPGRVFVARAGRHELTSTLLSPAQVHELVERMLKSSGRRIDLSQPFVDAMLPAGHRLNLVLEGISRGFSAVNIRKFVVRAARLHDLVALGSLTEQAASFLDASMQAGLNVVVAGSTQAGKTTMLNCLAASVPGGDRVVSVEEVFELTNKRMLHTRCGSSAPD